MLLAMLGSQPLFDSEIILHMTVMLGICMPFVRVGDPNSQPVAARAVYRVLHACSNLSQNPKPSCRGTSSVTFIRTLGNSSSAEPRPSLVVLLGWPACSWYGCIPTDVSPSETERQMCQGVSIAQARAVTPHRAGLAACTLSSINGHLVELHSDRRKRNVRIMQGYSRAPCAKPVNVRHSARQ